MLQTPASPDDFVDATELTDRLVELAGTTAGLSVSARARVIGHLKKHLARGREEAERRLKADGKGTLCAALLSDLQDAIVGMLNLPPGEIIAAFTSLELKGMIQQLPGQLVVRRGTA